MRLLLVALAATLATCALAASTATAGGGRVFGIEDCNKPEVRPDRIVLACADFGLYINHLDWKSWGGQKSRATGVIHARTCDPICPGSPYRDFPVKVRYYKPRNRPCGGSGLIHMYTRLHLSFPAGEPDGIGPYRDSKVTCF
jgi:hypothetical protein